MQLKIEKKIWPLNQTFNISRGSKSEAVTIELQLTYDGYIGRGECVPTGPELLSAATPPPSRAAACHAH